MTDETESEILKAFAAIHSLGVIHGDIRADNILVAKGGKSAWIVDFEFAEIVAGDMEENSKIDLEIGTVKELLAKLKISPKSYRNDTENSDDDCRNRGCRTDYSNNI